MDEADVSLSLDCIGSRKELTNCGDAKKITNTIQTANLPIYTVGRKELKNIPLTVTLTWTVAGSYGSDDKQTTYEEIPRIIPYVTD